MKRFLIVMAMMITLSNQTIFADNSNSNLELHNNNFKLIYNICIKTSDLTTGISSFKIEL